MAKSNNNNKADEWKKNKTKRFNDETTFVYWNEDFLRFGHCTKFTCFVLGSEIDGWICFFLSCL